MQNHACTITHQSQVSSYGRLTRRVNQTILDAQASHERSITLRALPEDGPDDWDRLLDELSQCDQASINRLPDGSVLISWGAITP